MPSSSAGYSRLLSWGAYTFGALGIGPVSQDQLSPKNIIHTPPMSWAAVSAGANYACAMDEVQALYCWGMNAQGQLGAGDTTDRWSPEKVKDLASVAVVSTGQVHTCAVAEYGETSIRKLYCWGGNLFGKLGDGSDDGKLIPTAVVGGHEFASVSAGLEHTCAITNGGGLYCWGSNVRGELGIGTSDDAVHSSPDPAGPAELIWTQITAGDSLSCGLVSTEAYCWGDNRHGQLGKADYIDMDVPTAVIGGHAFASLITKSQHVCGVRTDGELYCWGYNADGQLGGGGTDDQNAPRLVASDLEFKSVSASGFHTCGVLVSNDLYCWGANTNGQLGTGDLAVRHTPTYISEGWESISAGDADTYGMQLPNP